MVRFLSRVEVMLSIPQGWTGSFVLDGRYRVTPIALTIMPSSQRPRLRIHRPETEMGTSHGRIALTWYS